MNCIFRTWGICCKEWNEGGVKKIKVKNSQLLGTDTGIIFNTRSGRGGVVVNIYIKNISMTDIVSNTIIFSMFYGGKNFDKIKVDETTPIIRNININNIFCNDAEGAIYFTRLTEMFIDGFKLKDIVILMLKKFD